MGAWNDLPRDLLANIASSFDSGNIAAARLVCKVWTQASAGLGTPACPREKLLLIVQKVYGLAMWLIPLQKDPRDQSRRAQIGLADCRAGETAYRNQCAGSSPALMAARSRCSYTSSISARYLPVPALTIIETKFTCLGHWSNRHLQTPSKPVLLGSLPTIESQSKAWRCDCLQQSQ